MDKNLNMKQQMILLTSLACVFLHGIVSAQVIDFGIYNNPSGSNKMEIRLRASQNVVDGALSAGVFTVRYPAAYGVNLTVVPASSPYGFAFAGPVGNSGGYRYYRFQFANNFNVNWTAGQEYTAVVLQHSNDGSGIGSFELVTNDSWTNGFNGNFYIELDGNEKQGVFYHPSTAVPLPVELNAFNAKALHDGSVMLDWESATERNMAYYAVEHSKDGHQFNELGKEPARGSEQSVAAYVYNHKTPAAGLNYYRLRMVDQRGAYEYSPIRQVLMDGEDADFTLLPNPSSGPLTLTSRHLDKYAEGLTFQITDEQGRIIRTDRLVSEKTGLDLGHESSGSYFLQIRSNREIVAVFPIMIARQ